MGEMHAYGEMHAHHIPPDVLIFEYQRINNYNLKLEGIPECIPPPAVLQ